MADGGDKAREDFFSEAQELVETLSRSLLGLDEHQRAGTEEPALVNGAFRAVHTLKSLAGIFGAQDIAVLSHRLEDVLDKLRLGRLSLTANLLDVLFQSVELYWQLLAFENDGEGSAPDIKFLMASLNALVSDESAPEPLPGSLIDPALLSVLTEYEEHRLQSCLKQGLGLYRVRVKFELVSIDKDLEAIKAKAKPLGEVITYLPTGESASADVIELDLLLASGVALSELERELGSEQVGITALPTAARITQQPAPLVTSPLASEVAAEDESTYAPKGGGDADEHSMAPAAMIRSVTQTVRVDIRRLDLLMDAVGELTIVRGAIARLGERLRGEGQRGLGTEILRLNRDFERRLRELQEGILEVRMVPLSQVFDRLTRVVRQISRELNKEVRLVITGGETEIDKVLVEELSDPLMHIVRNAIDHGIEDADRRRELSKPSAGTIALNAFQKGNHVVLEVEDDGGGIRAQSLVDRAVKLGALSTSDAIELNRSDALNLMFLPGLSTREKADEHSGRGVGMDVVKTNIGKLGGVIDLRSEENIGTQITVTLPITLAIVNALLVRVSERIFAIPLSSVSEALALDPSALRWVEGREVWIRDGATLPLCRLSELFGIPEQAGSRRGFVVVVAAGPRRAGLVVTHLVGQEDIVIKALGPSLSGVRGIAGASELGEQGVALVLDVANLIEEVLTFGDSRLAQEAG